VLFWCVGVEGDSALAWVLLWFFACFLVFDTCCMLVSLVLVSLVLCVFGFFFAGLSSVFRAPLSWIRCC